jgi:hypothetical protein
VPFRSPPTDQQLSEIVLAGRHLLISGAFDLSKDEPSGEKLLRLLHENQIDLIVVEGLRLVIAFNKISDPSDRRVLIELAERLAK